MCYNSFMKKKLKKRRNPSTKGQWIIFKQNDNGSWESIYDTFNQLSDALEIARHPHNGVRMVANEESGQVYSTKGFLQKQSASDLGMFDLSTSAKVEAFAVGGVGVIIGLIIGKLT